MPVGTSGGWLGIVDALIQGFSKNTNSKGWTMKSFLLSFLVVLLLSFLWPVPARAVEQSFASNNVFIFTEGREGPTYEFLIDLYSKTDTFIYGGRFVMGTNRFALYIPFGAATIDYQKTNTPKTYAGLGMGGFILGPYDPGPGGIWFSTEYLHLFDDYQTDTAAVNLAYAKGVPGVNGDAYLGAKGSYSRIQRLPSYAPRTTTDQEFGHWGPFGGLKLKLGDQFTWDIQGGMLLGLDGGDDLGYLSTSVGLLF